MTMTASDILIRDWNCYEIGEEKIEYIRAKELLVSNRIDLVVKYKFVEAYDKGMKIPFIEELYYAHLDAFSDGRFVEPGKEDEKKSFEDYLTTFTQLINSIKKEGVRKDISVIPVGRNNAIINGSHRVAIAMYFDLEVPIVRYNDIEINYNYNFFKARFLDQRYYLEYMVTEYIRLKENIYFACVWPRADKAKQKEIDKLIKNNCDVVYKSSVKLGYNGLKNLMIQIYGKQEWCGNIRNGYKGISGKADECYRENVETLIYVLDNTDLESISKLKQKIRSVYQIGNSSVHISDNSQESLEIAHMLLNCNSVDVLNYGDMCRYKNYITLIQQLEEQLESYGIDKEDVLIDSSGVLGIYGIRNPGDIDYLTFNNLPDNLLHIKMAVHDENIPYYLKSKEELIYDPKYYLYAFGIKFCTLTTLFNMKTRRKEKKDQEDCLLIKPYLEKQMTHTDTLYQYIIKFRRQYRNLCVRIRSIIFSLLKAMHLYEFVRNIYRAIKGTER